MTSETLRIFTICDSLSACDQNNYWKLKWAAYSAIDDATRLFRGELSKIGLPHLVIGEVSSLSVDWIASRPLNESLNENDLLRVFPGADLRGLHVTEFKRK